MGHHNDPVADSPPSDWYGGSALPSEERSRLNAACARASDETAAAIARELNGPLTALLLYMGEIKRHSDQLSADRAHLHHVVENALTQTERVCALVKQLANSPRTAASAPSSLGEIGPTSGREQPIVTRAASDVSGPLGQRRLTRREREVLRLISEGYSNKQGALRMQISPRTFESHRAEAMRKLGARNTAELVRAALLHAIE
jgi:DNA-binding CsgD family transcriptional regulator